MARGSRTADAVAARMVSIEEGSRRLAQIVAAPRTYDRFTSFLTHGITAGAVAVFFGGAWPDVASAAVIGLGLGVLAQLVHRSSAQARVFELVGATFAAFAAGLAARIAPVSASPR